MTDKTEYEIQNGERAAQLLQEPILVEALETIEQEYIDQWKNSPVRDHEAREKLWLMVKTAQKFRLELEQVMNTGKVARATLAQRLGQKLNPFS
jgi:hypothetical protein